ncbi:biotin--[acetyl-CoA-carboxylase] ligase [Kurthia sibirica]|uniref:Bifunctional ligase/repressor BirA n=1 Tax=Kurthia sibirica TaxID=202750 RepID=A0A2U3AI64_9BACL|nr:biotin--[acetyl-CoA-carboxylase] ligase [Kurthia sibirica]PWI24239.1 biotin--[acetyl-CoA-carboxylase] ligase [Kurthia sibirica]GEK34138.1 bifunctional ligase/repressor BirA [Kurthia sibirica]
MSGTIKHEILKKLQHAGTEPTSGQALADQLSVSRTAIWKYIKQLEADGYSFETIHKKGYILKNEPNLIDAARIKAALDTPTFGQAIHYFDTLPSTQPVAHQLAQEGAAAGTVVICEEQTAGRGRMQRQWVSQKGKGIWMSVILRPDVPPYEAPQFTLVAAVAIVKAIEDVVGISPKIKWPNDLLIDSLKITGILTELQADPDYVNALIMGLGINVNHMADDFPDDIKDIATSLKIQSGKEIDRAHLVARILYYLEFYSDKYVAEGFIPIKKEWENYSCTIGQKIKVTTVKEVFHGVAVGITNDGVLKVQLPDGETKSVYSADIELA